MKVRARSARVRPARWNPFLSERTPDPYKQPKASPPAATCPVCHAVYFRGHWQRRAGPSGAASLVCSACQRMADGIAAGRVTLGGSFEAEHRKEIHALVRHRAKSMEAAHPMERLMTIEASDQGTVITTTGVHLARDIGNAVHQAYRGELKINYQNAETEFRVDWRRD